MALIDHEAVLLDLEAHVASKASHGRRELTDLIQELRVRHRQTEGLPERVGRVYLPGLIAEIASGRPASPEPNGNGQMAESSPHRGSP